MKKNILVLLVAMCLLVGILSGCTEEKNEVPEASFTYQVDNEYVDTEISFTDTSEDDDTLTWMWDFGNGDTSTEQNPKYTYAEAGNYTVTLNVTDENDQTDEYSVDITITLKDIVTTADTSDDPTFSTLVTALTAAELVETLQGDGPFTVFAPTDAAFDLLNETWLLNLLADETNLSKVLTYHVVDGKVMSSDLVNGTVMTLEGTNVTIVVDTNVTVDGVTVTTPDIECKNGVIHIIDEVLLPDSVPGPEE